MVTFFFTCYNAGRRARELLIRLQLSCHRNLGVILDSIGLATRIGARGIIGNKSFTELPTPCVVRQALHSGIKSE